MQPSNTQAQPQAGHMVPPTEAHKNGFWDKIKKHQDIFHVTMLFIFWRAALELIGLLGANAFGFISSGTVWDERVTALTNMWTRWDSGWYLNIVEHGYQWIEPSVGQSNVAFFPLYPYLIKVLAFPFESNPFLVGTIVSSLALLGALIYLFKLVELDYGRDTAYRTLMLILVFPMSFFFASVYTESLFLFVSVASLYHGRKNQWMAASIFGFLASFTRLVGVALTLLLLIEYLKQKNWKFSKIRADIGYIWMIPLGLFAYMYILQIKLGSALLFFRAQEAWHRTTELPFNVIRTEYWPLALDASTYMNRLELSKVFDLFFFGLAVLLIILCFIFLRKSYALFALFAMLPSMLTGTLDSIGRYMIVVFPFFILLARATKWKPLEILYIMLFGALLTYNIILFVNWNWVA